MGGPRCSIYAGSKSGLSKTPLKILEGNHQYSRFGYSTAAADVNGDGIDDVIVGAFQWGYERSCSGPAVHGGACGGIPRQQDRPTFCAGLDGPRKPGGSAIGVFVASAGDVNRDGFEDVLVGTPNYDVTAGSTVLANAGLVHLFHGSKNGLGADPAWTGQGSVASEAFGSSIHGAGDVNKDGYDDVIVGANTPGIVRLPKGDGRMCFWARRTGYRCSLGGSWMAVRKAVALASV